MRELGFRILEARGVCFGMYCGMVASQASYIVWDSGGRSLSRRFRFDAVEGLGFRALQFFFRLYGFRGFGIRHVGFRVLHRF